MDSDGDDNISLNSTEDEAEDGKAYVVDDVLAEKQNQDGKTFWLVSWEGYSSDYHMWLPEENFDDSDTLQEWEFKKQKIQEGIEKPYDWEAWDRNQALLKQRKHDEKEVRKEKREIKRARLGAVERKGYWTLPKYRRRIYDGRKYRSSDDDTYSEDEDEDEDSDDDQDTEHNEDDERDRRVKSRPAKSRKRKIVTISDSDDDAPLISLGRTKSVSERVEILAPSAGPVLNLPIRSSQSPFPPEHRPPVGLQKPMEETGPSAPAVNNQTPGTTNVTQPLPPQPVQSVAKTYSDTAAPIPARLNATSSTFPSQKKSTIPRSRPTAIRSTIPRRSQDENCFIKPVRRPRPRALSGKRNLESPTAKDFFKKVPVSWNQPPRDKDTRQPNLSNMTLMSISTAAQQTGIRAKRRDSVSANSPTGMTRRQSQPSVATSTISSPTVAPNAIAGYVRSNGLGSGNHMDTEMDTVMDIAPPVAPVTAAGQQSLFVTDDDVEMEDVPELQNNSTGTTGSERRHKQPAQYSAFQSATSPTSSHYPTFSPTRSSFASRPTQRHHAAGTEDQRVPRDRRESRSHVPSGPVTTVIDLNGISAVPVGNLESLELRHFRGQRLGFSPTYLQLDISENVQIQVQIKDFNTKQHHDLLQFESQSVETRVLHYEQECETFEEFLQLYERKDENMFFSAGILEPNPRYSESRPQLSVIKHGTICYGRYISLLIWCANNPAWGRVSKRFIHSSTARFCVLMFKTTVRPQIRQIAEHSSNANRQQPRFVIRTFSDATSYLSKDSLAALQRLSGQASSLEEKRSALYQILARPGAFSQSLASEQKVAISQVINQAMFSGAGDRPSIVHASETRSPPNRTITMSSEDPRLHHKKTEQRSTILNHPASISEPFSFSTFHQSFMAQVPHTPNSAVQIFREKLGINWSRMINPKEPKVNVLYLYPKECLSQELSVLKEFLHAIRARVEDADNTVQAKSFCELTESRIEHHSGDETKMSTRDWDPDKHIRIKKGENGIVLLHPSVSPSESLWNALASALVNPNVRVFRVTLGQSYLDRNAVNIQPQPGAVESCKDGEHVLLTDSVILKCPKHALNMLHWLSLKQDGGRSQLWKVYARPALSSWIEELVLANRANVELAGIYQQFSEMLMNLVPIEDRQYLDGDTWSSNELASMRMETVLPGYNYSIGTNPAINLLDIDLEHNDRQLVEWFSDTTASMHEQYRFFSVFCAMSGAFCKNLKGRHRYLRVYPGSWATKAYFKAEELKARWRKEGKLAGSGG